MHLVHHHHGEFIKSAAKKNTTVCVYACIRMNEDILCKGRPEYSSCVTLALVGVALPVSLYLCLCACASLEIFFWNCILAFAGAVWKQANPE